MFQRLEESTCFKAHPSKPYFKLVARSCELNPLHTFMEASLMARPSLRATAIMR